MTAAGTGKARARKPRRSRGERKQHILNAMVNCVRRSGFHGASMNAVAVEAGLSVGIIYRYFASKEAIIEAIVSNDLAELRDRFTKWENTPNERLIDTVLEMLDAAVERRYDRDYAALALEVLAEAGRNPSVAAMVERADAQERELGRDLCSRIMPGTDPDLMDARSEIIGMLFDGMLVRAISNPQTDREGLLRDLRKLLQWLFTEPPMVPSSIRSQEG